MSGLINTGIDYQNRALSGFVRESAEQNEIDSANKELDSARKAQKTQMAVTGTTSGAMVGAYVGAEYGSVGGPWGAVIGAGLGYLFSQLF
ncbi:MAG: hypothetical protein WCV62_05690 [Candidatus Peribacteraceae bacterium]|jgi:hypothetical protein